MDPLDILGSMFADPEEQRRRAQAAAMARASADAPVMSQMQQLPPSLGTAISAVTGDWGGRPVAPSPLVPAKDYGYNPDTGLPNPPKQDTYQPPLNSMMPGAIQPDMTGIAPMLTSKDFTGPEYNEKEQSLLSGPVIDRSVDGSMNGSAHGWGGIPSYVSGPILDNFVPTDPIHTLGYSGTGGTTAPSVDNWGPNLRRQAAQQSLTLMDILNHRDEAAQRNAMMMGTLGNKNQMALDHALALSGNSKIPDEVAGAEIGNLVKGHALDPKQANAMILGRAMSSVNEHGQYVPAVADKKTGSMLQLLQRVPGNIPPEEVLSYLEKNRGITRDMVVNRFNDLMKAGMPWYASGWLKDQAPDLFDPKNLSADQLAEYNAILRTVGTRKK